MNDPEIFQLTEQDKLRYLKLIKKINLEQKYIIMNILGKKIQNILDDGKVNSIEAKLIGDMAELVEILEMHTNLSELTIKKILFAMSYFIDDDDEIPDLVEDYGYLDDVAVVKWILDDIKQEIPEIYRA
tara:strand:- start:8023 stop:8409 length:387 start_codon:yes stop_codon:yes gene_type:complete